MEYDVFKRYVGKAGFTLKEFAVIIGMHHRSISNYSTQPNVPQHLALMALMMVELDKRDVDVKAIAEKIGGPRRQRKRRQITEAKEEE